MAQPTRIPPVMYAPTLPQLPHTPGSASNGVPSTPIHDYALTVPSYSQQGSIPPTPPSSFPGSPPTKRKDPKLKADLKVWHTFDDIVGEELFERYGLKALQLKMGTRRALSTITADVLENECEMKSFADRQKAMEKIAAVLFNLKSYFPDGTEPITYSSLRPPVVPEEVHHQMYWPADANELFTNFGIRMHQLMDGAIPGLSRDTVLKYKRAYFFRIVYDRRNSLTMYLNDLIDGCIGDDNPPANMKEKLMKTYDGYGTPAAMIATIAIGNLLLSSSISVVSSRASVIVMVASALSATSSMLCMLSSADVSYNISQCADEAIQAMVAIALDRWYLTDCVRRRPNIAAVMSVLYDPLHFLLFSVFSLGIAVWNVFVVYAQTTANLTSEVTNFDRKQFEVPLLPCEQQRNANDLLLVVALIFALSLSAYFFRRAWVALARRRATLGYTHNMGKKEREDRKKFAAALREARNLAKIEEKKKLERQLETLGLKGGDDYNDLLSGFDNSSNDDDPSEVPEEKICNFFNRDEFAIAGRYLTESMFGMFLFGTMALWALYIAIGYALKGCTSRTFSLSKTPAIW